MSSERQTSLPNNHSRYSSGMRGVDSSTSPFSSSRGGANGGM